MRTIKQSLTVFALLTALIMWSIPQHAKAETPTITCGEMANIPVLHDGRLKPFSSVAFILTKQIHGTSDMTLASGETISACDWLTETIFDPATSLKNTLFLIANPELRDFLGLPTTQRHFTLEQIAPAMRAHEKLIEELLTTPPKELTETQGSLLELYNAISLEYELARTLTLILPIAVNPPDWVLENIDAKPPYSYLSFVPIESEAQQALMEVVKTKGEDVVSYSKEEIKLAGLMFSLNQLKIAAQGEGTLKIIPAGFAEKDLWVAPWNIIEGGYSSPENMTYLNDLREIAFSYLDQDRKTFSQKTKAFKNALYQNELTDTQRQRLSLESLYITVKPYHWVITLYLLSLALVLLGRRYSLNSPKTLAGLSLITGMVCHASAMTARIYILDRPPVGTLYESLLFVSLICAIIGSLIYFRRKDITGLISGVGLGSILLAIAPYILRDNDPLGVLSAVLNTNFWLATHVLCITIGYGVCLITGVLAHFALFQRGFSNAEPNQILEERIYRISMVALLFTAVGTILGGIWADQSWGRFWGWDPKENGALLIVLWLIWIQHGRLSGHLSKTAFLMTMAFINVIVALAWFGVNLLGVGLHSYGFISGIGFGLLSFCVMEILLILLLFLRIQRSKMPAST